ncbi:alpha-galactosidase [Caldanaerobius fijiensis DSM 17918]|uniref:alpha-galactosidase n=1 Tax=Caldanaerobius fijiensis DSM 17918 TaxID=1121256 RepID=A0A1M5C7H0_9THEO|nr:alpha-galactosidase [Caldanaerobius fijiensis]SHF50724.1 alpha-galactosidase [Caldanaerobius fijiensis DSM 17918]
MSFAVAYDGKLYVGDADFKLVDQKIQIHQEFKQNLSIWMDGALKVNLYSIEYDCGVNEKWMEIINVSSRNVTINRADSLYVTVEQPYCELLYFTSGWGKEFSPACRALHDSFELRNLKGRSSADFYPWFALLDSRGHILSASVAWSGNWVFRFEKVGNGYLISGGLSDKDFEKSLKPGEMMVCPRVIIVEADNFDLDEMANKYIRWGRKYWYPSNSISRDLSVEWNHWWPYEDIDINEEIFKANVDKAAQMGIQVCTLDAGWFGPSDKYSRWYDVRGDWEMVNSVRFSSGIRALADYVHEKGLKFGIWCEIEALGEKAALRFNHPEFEARRDGKSLGYICFGNPEVQEWAFRMLDRIVTEYTCDWIKLDFNLDPGAGCNRIDHGHGEGDGLYEHYMGYYRVLARLRERHPELLIENCSSGGLRMDLGIMRNAYNTYVSDPDTPLHDLQLFWGATLILAPNVCLHWPWSHSRTDKEGKAPYPPLDLVNQRIDKAILDCYVRIGMLNWFGYSHKLAELPEYVFERLKYHVEFYSRYIKPFVAEADLYRLCGQTLREDCLPIKEGSPHLVDNTIWGKAGDRWSAFQFVMPDKNKSVLFVFRMHNSETTRRLKLKGLEPDATYVLTFNDRGERLVAKGQELMEEGLVFDYLAEENSEVVFIRKI